MQQVTKEQVDAMVQQIDNHEAIVERFKEHPTYVQYKELEKIQRNGSFIQHTLNNEVALIEKLKQQAGQMINILNQMQAQQQQMQQMPPPVQQPMQPPAPQPTPQPQPPTPQPTPQPLPPPVQQPTASAQTDAFNQPISQPQPPVQQSAPAPVEPPVVQQERTPEQEAAELFQATSAEMGTDEKVEGIPEIEELEEFEKMGGQQQQQPPTQ